MLTLATLACAVAVAHGQVSVPGVQTPSVETPPLQNLPQVPSTPSVPVPKVPSVQVPSVKTPSVQVPKAPSVKLPSGSTPKLPSSSAPSAGGRAGSATGNSSGAGAAAGRAQAGSPATATAASKRAARHRQLTPRQRSARHERRLRTAARELEGCLPALSGFERDVIVLRGGLHGHRPLSRSKTAARLDVDSGRVRSAERSGLAGLRRADAEQGCGLRSGAGRDAAARRLADGSVPGLSPLAVAGTSPALVSTDKLARDNAKVLGEHASSGPAAKQEPRRAGIVPTSGGDDPLISGAALAAVLAALLAAALVAALLVWRRRTADPYGHSHQHQPSVYPYGWSSYESSTPTEPSAPPEPTAAPESPVVPEPAPRPRRRDRAMQAAGGLAASGAALSLLLGRLASRRRRR